MTDRMDIRLTTTSQNFKIEKYTDKDDYGKEYPLLRMKLETTES